MDNNETLADILAEMRTYFQMKKRNGTPEHRPWHQVLSDWADRIGAATVREIRAERTEAIDEALAHAEEVRAEKCCNCERAPGNAAALRAALEICLKKMCGYCREAAGRCGYDVPCVDGCEPLKMAMSALAAPARNCDVGTAQEQSVRMAKFCRAQYEKSNVGSLCGSCQFNDMVGIDCQFGWAQMPYKAEGGGKHGGA